MCMEEGGTSFLYSPNYPSFSPARLSFRRTLATTPIRTQSHELFVPGSMYAKLLSYRPRTVPFASIRSITSLAIGSLVSAVVNFKSVHASSIKVKRVLSSRLRVLGVVSVFSMRIV